MTRPNKLECLHLAKTFQSSPTFAGNTRSLPRKEASERSSNWVWSCPQILRPDWKGLPRANPLAYWALSSVTREKSFITLTSDEGIGGQPNFLGLAKAIRKLRIAGIFQHYYPEGGWGYLVLFCAVLVQILAPGTPSINFLRV